MKSSRPTIIFKLVIFLSGTLLLLCAAFLYIFWDHAALQKRDHEIVRYESQILTQTAVTWSETLDHLLLHLADHTGLNHAVKRANNDPADLVKQLNEVVQSPYVLPHSAISLVSLSDEWIYTNSELSLHDFDQIISHQALRTDNSMLIYPGTYDNQPELLLLRAMSSADSFRQALVAVHVPFSQIEQFLLEKSQLQHKKLRLLAPSVFTKPAYTATDLQALGLPTTATIVPISKADLYLAWWSDGTATNRTNDLIWRLLALLPLILLCGLGSWLITRHTFKPLNQLVHDYEIEVEHQTSVYQSIAQYINHKQMEISDLEEQLSGFIPDLKLSTFQHLLWGELAEHELLDRIERLKLPLTGDSFYIAVASIDEYTQFLTRSSKQDQLTIHHQLRAQAFELFTGPLNVVTFTPRHGLITILIGVPKSVLEADKLIHSLSDQYRDWVCNHYEFTLSLAISRARRGYSSFSASYHEALALMSDRMTLGNNITILASDRQPVIVKPNHSMMQQCKHTARLIMQGQNTEAAAEIDSLLELIAEQNYKSETALGIFAHLIGELEYMLFELHVHIHDIFEDNIYDVLYAKSTLMHIRNWLVETVCETISVYLSKQHISKQKQLAQQVIHHIHDSYDQDLTLQQVAEQLAISVSQLSRVFKDETGKTFSESLIQYRMQKSADLLENTDMSIKDIADKMRYTNVQNFSRIFKQIIGVPPGEYRKQVKEL